MLGSIVSFFSPWHHLQLPLAGLVLTVGILATQVPTVLPNELPNSSISPVAVGTEVTKEMSMSGESYRHVPRGKLPKQDGVYLYGQSPQPQQVGKEYMVFELRDGEVTGAFFLPYSEFNCFHGTLQSGKLALMVADGSDSGSYLEPDLEQSQQVATTGNRSPLNNGAYPYAVALQEYYQLESVSAENEKVLRSCKNSYQQ